MSQTELEQLEEGLKDMGPVDYVVLAWPDGQPLLSASCPSCARRVTLPAAMLERWSARSLSG